jgi:hypothetical protein
VEFGQSGLAIMTIGRPVPADTVLGSVPIGTTTGAVPMGTGVMVSVTTTRVVKSTVVVVLTGRSEP